MLCIIASMKMYICVYLPTFCLKNKELVRSNVSSTTLLLSLHCSANITVPPNTHGLTAPLHAHNTLSGQLWGAGYQQNKLLHASQYTAVNIVSECDASCCFQTITRGFTGFFLSRD